MQRLFQKSGSQENGLIKTQQKCMFASLRATWYLCFHDLYSLFPLITPKQGISFIPVSAIFLKSKKLFCFVFFSYLHVETNAYGIVVC